MELHDPAAFVDLARKHAQHVAAERSALPSTVGAAHAKIDELEMALVSAARSRCVALRAELDAAFREKESALDAELASADAVLSLAEAAAGRRSGLDDARIHDPAVMRQLHTAVSKFSIIESGFLDVRADLTEAKNAILRVGRIHSVTGPSAKDVVVCAPVLRVRPGHVCRLQFTKSATSRAEYERCAWVAALLRSARVDVQLQQADQPISAAPSKSQQMLVDIPVRVVLEPSESFDAVDAIVDIREYDDDSRIAGCNLVVRAATVAGHDVAIPGDLPELRAAWVSGVRAPWAIARVLRGSLVAPAVTPGGGVLIPLSRHFRAVDFYSRPHTTEDRVSSKSLSYKCSAIAFVEMCSGHGDAMLALLATTNRPYTYESRSAFFRALSSVSMTKLDPQADSRNERDMWKVRFDGYVYGIAVMPSRGVCFVSVNQTGLIHGLRLKDGVALVDPVKAGASTVSQLAADSESGLLFASTISPYAVHIFRWVTNDPHTSPPVLAACLECLGPLHAVGLLTNWAVLAVMPPAPGAATSHLIVGTSGSSELRIIALPGLQRVCDVSLPAGIQVIGLAADPLGRALVVCDGASRSVQALRWPLDGMALPVLA